MNKTCKNVSNKCIQFALSVITSKQTNKTKKKKMPIKRGRKQEDKMSDNDTVNPIPPRFGDLEDRTEFCTITSKLA